MIKRRLAIPSIPSLEDVERLAREAGFSKELVLIRNVTNDMFSGEVSEEVDYDPDEPTDCFILFSVSADGDIESLVSVRGTFELLLALWRCYLDLKETVVAFWSFEHV